MKRTPKAAFFIVAILILVLSFTALFGVYTRYGDRVDTVIRGVDGIRWGIDIRGGVDVTYGPKDDSIEVTEEQLDAVKSVIEQRMVGKNITDYEAYTDPANRQVIVRFPWDGTSASSNEAAAYLGNTAQLAFYIGEDYVDATDENGNAVKVPTGELILTGDDVASATPQPLQDEYGNVDYVVQLKLKESGTAAFAEATRKQYDAGGVISIWLDSDIISAPKVSAVITDGSAVIEGMESMEAAKELASLITSGALPFEVEVKSQGWISPTMGSSALNAMAIAAAIAMALVVLIMILVYRLPGVVASIALCGQMAATIAAISGYFAVFDSFTMTLPGIAGLILSIGIGVDCNVITAESVRDELRAGKTIDSAIRSGSKNSFWAIFDGNITVLIVAAVLMGVFGSADSLFGWLFSWLPVSTTGSVYAFGYTLLIGVITNFVFGVWLSRLMLKSVSRLKVFRKPWFYGGDRA